MSLRVGLDMDGVVADFRSAFREAAGAAGVALPVAAEDAPPQPLSTGQIKRIWEHIRRTQNWWVGLKPYEPDQLPRLYEIARRLKWEVVFMTRRPATLGDSVQFQSQWWLEEHGFFYPAVVTVPGSRGELANSLRLDIAVDDQVHNCVDIVSASTAKAMALLRDGVEPAIQEHATSRGIGVVASLAEAIDVLTHLHESLRERKGRLHRLADWFSGRAAGAKMPAPPSRDRAPLSTSPDEPS